MAFQTEIFQGMFSTIIIIRQSPACGNHLIHLQENQTHQLVSPNAPASYPLNIRCVWFVTAPLGTAVLISTVTINLYSRATLTVGDGPLVNQTRSIWTGQGGTAPLTVSSAGNDVWVTFELESSYRDYPGNAHFVLELSVLDQSVNCSGEYEVACESGYQCVNESDVCDGIFHCWDKSDELSCGDCAVGRGLPCEVNEEQICLPATSICNGIAECADFLDETLCSTFVCGRERYIKLEDYPDYTYNISSIETGYPPLVACLWIFTASPEYRIRLDVKRQNTTNGDGVTNVGSGVDPTERSSLLRTFLGYSPPSSIAAAENSMWMTFQVTNVYGFGGSFWYQVIAYNESVSCEEGNFWCESSSLCIGGHLQCDGVPNCQDFSDEIGCDICNGQSTINITDDRVHILRANIEEDWFEFPSGKSCAWQIVASVGHRIQLTIVELDLGDSDQYVDYGDTGRTKLVFSDGIRYATGPDLFFKTYGLFSKTTVTSKTNDVLVSFQPGRSLSARFTVELKQFEPLECEEGDIVCPSGLACVPEHELCDGTPQCPLLGDEIGCGSCESDDFQCDGRCIDAIEKVCDGSHDCLDVADENNCLPCGKQKIVLQNGTATSAPLSSPNYPAFYPNRLNCVWLVTADPNTVISFEFSVFDLELRYDILNIGNGESVSDRASAITSLTGPLNSVRVVTKASKAWVQFTSDSSVSSPGFSGTITQINSNGVCRSDEFSCEDAAGLLCFSKDNTCKGYAVCKDGSDEQYCGSCGSLTIHVFDEDITLTSPAYPDPYPPLVSCLWQVIPGESEFPMVFTVMDFGLEQTYDYVTFSTGNSQEDLVEVLRLTGSNTPVRRLIWTETVWVSFVSDTSVVYKGFSFLISINENATDCDVVDFDCENDISFGFVRYKFCIDSAAECNGFNDCRNNRDESLCDDVVCPGAYKCNRLDSAGSASGSSPSSATGPSPTGGSFSGSSPSSATGPSLTGGSFTVSSPSSATGPSPTGESIPSTSSSFSYSSYSSASSSSYSSASPTSQSEGSYVSSRCISVAKVCDGNSDCPGTDDETECDVKKCPAGCECSYRDGDLNVTCTNGWNSTLLTGVAVTTSLLQLSGENISSLEPGTFKALKNLKVLSLKNNIISEIKENTFDSLDDLLWLDLSNTSLVELQEFTFSGLHSLQGITLFDVPLERVRDYAFQGLGQLDTLILVRQHNNLPRLMFEKGSFEGLVNLKRLYVDDHRICCFFDSTVVDCKTLEPEPPLFMCSNLMPNLVLKTFMWILGISALVGNLFVMIWRCREETEGRASRKVHSLLVFNLAASDSLMGLYMLIIAIADVHFGDTYFEHSSEWQTSVSCRLAGFISIIASEASVFFLTLISVDRYLSIVFPFSSHHIRPKTGRIISGFIWIGTVIIGLVPTILAFDSSSDLYGLSDVCIGLPLITKVARYETRMQTIDAGGVANISVEIPYAAEYRASWFFSIALFLGVNLLCFCVILICYICIFVSVKMSMKRVRRHKSRDDEVRMAIKMAAIVMTDFICWTPVIIMGILSQSRVVEIPPETYAWVVVFILPINSSLNPYLYTISDLCSLRRRSASTRKKDTSKYLNNENKNSNSMDTVFTIDTASKHE